MSYAVEFTQGAEDDLVRLYDFLLDRAETLEELDVAEEAVKVIRQAALSHLSTTPYSYRKVGARSTLRELIVPFGTTGYILRFDIRSPELVLVVGARHQREEDFHCPFQAALWCRGARTYLYRLSAITGCSRRAACWHLT